MTIKRCWTGLASVGLLAAASLAWAQDGQTAAHAAVVEQHGEMRPVMRLGKTQGRVSLADAVAEPHAFGVGALAGLAGEVTILDGNVWVSRPAGGAIETSGPAVIDGDRATLLTLAHVAEWRATPLERDAGGRDLEAAIAAAAAQAGVDVDAPFPFVLRGEAARLSVHVINGYCPVAVDPKAIDAQPWHWKSDTPTAVTIVGFHAKGTAGVMTHHGTNLHAHAVLEVDGQTVTAHVDDVDMAAGSVLQVPSSGTDAAPATRPAVSPADQPTTATTMPATPAHRSTLDAAAFAAKLDEVAEPQLIDLRDLGETGGDLLPGAELVPWADGEGFATRLAAAELETSRPLFVYCRSGRRSAAALPLLREAGFDDVVLLDGGIVAWREAGLATARNAAVFWDEMYSRDGYLYGKMPNDFFAAQLAELPKGRLLLPAEGEGRNGVYAAKLGWSVDAFDISSVAREKALTLADEAGVSLDYRVADFGEPDLGPAVYDAVALIYSHVPPGVKERGHAAIVESLKPGGVVIVECFDKSHADLNAGFGPREPDLLYREDELRRDFSGFEIERLDVTTDTFEHGRHKGEGRVVRMIARKPAEPKEVD